MILFTILLITLAILLIATAVTLGLGASVFIILFADVIVCFVIIGYIISRIFKKKGE